MKTVKYANIIEAVEYIKEYGVDNVEFETPLSFSPIMLNMLSEEDKKILKSAPLKYSSKKRILDEWRVKNKMKKVYKRYCIRY